VLKIAEEVEVGKQFVVTRDEVRQNIFKYLGLSNVADDVFTKAVEQLTPREQLVLQLRFQSPAWSLCKIGDRLPKVRNGAGRAGRWCKGEIGITRERVRRIEAKALRKIRRE
jgi:DNA-directed RNA polymerase specialized sigma subunit